MIKLFQKKIVKTYSSIDDLPIFNWFRISDTNNLQWLLIDTKELKNIKPEVLQHLWKKIFDEFIDTFGVPEKMRLVWELKRDIFVLESELYLTGDRTILTFIDVKNIELNELLADEKAESNKQTNLVKVYIEKFLGFQLNEKETTVKEFYTYAEAYKAEINRSQSLSIKENVE